MKTSKKLGHSLKLIKKKLNVYHNENTFTQNSPNNLRILQINIFKYFTTLIHTSTKAKLNKITKFNDTSAWIRMSTHTRSNINGWWMYYIDLDVYTHKHTHSIWYKHLHIVSILFLYPSIHTQMNSVTHYFKKALILTYISMSVHANTLIDKHTQKYICMDGHLPYPTS